MKRAHIIAAVAAILTFAAGTATGRVVQHGYDQPAMKTEAERDTLRIVDGCTFTRTEGSGSSFLNFVCAGRKPTGIMR